MRIEEDTQRHITAAEGFLELGMLLDADAELDRTHVADRHLPEVLEVRAKVYSALQKWELLQAVAKRLWESTGKPSWCAQWADAIRKSGDVESARRVLLIASVENRKSAFFKYELARYECLLGEVKAAKSHLKSAIELDPSLRAAALADKDLEAVWQ